MMRPIPGSGACSAKAPAWWPPILAALLGMVGAGFLGCALDRVPATAADSWDYQQEQIACVSEGVTVAAVVVCRRASWVACGVKFGLCPAPEPQ